MAPVTTPMPEGTIRPSHIVFKELKDGFENGTGIAYGQDPLQYIKDQYHGREITTMQAPPGLKVYPAPFERLGCKPECRTCSKHYRPTVEQLIDSRMYDGAIDAVTAQRIAFAHARSITQDQAYLLDMIGKQGNTILNKWSKKNEVQRRELVRMAVPNLYEKKMPQAHIAYSHDLWRAKRPYRKTYLLPYLTVENLCDNKLKLPSLLHYRTSRAPEDWVMFDSDQFRDAYARGFFGLTFNDNCVAMDGSLYGLLVPYNREEVHAFACVGWPRARLILEAQAELLMCLRKIVEKLLETCTLGSGCGKWNTVLEAGLRAPGNQELWASFSAEPFSAPPVFEPTVLLELADNRQAAAEDELWLLQTDPSYAISQISQLRKLDLHKACGKLNKEPWSFVAADLHSKVSNRATMWRWIAQELRYICKLHAAAQLSAALGQAYQPDYTMAIGALHTLIKDIIVKRMEYSTLWVASYSGLQEYFEIYEDPKVGSALRLKKRLGKVRTDTSYMEEDFLFWIVAQLHTTDRRVNVEANKSFHLGLLDVWFAGASKQGKSKVDQCLYDLFTDLSGMQFILSSFRSQRPYCPPLNFKTAVRTQGERDDSLATWRDCTKGSGSGADVEALRLPGELLQVFYEGGVPKGKKDLKWLAETDRSRAALQNFWNAMHSVWENGLQPQYHAEVAKERASILKAVNVPGPFNVEQTLPDWAANSSIPSRPANLKRTAVQTASVTELASFTDDIAEKLAKVENADSTTKSQGIITVNKESLSFFDMMFGVTRHTGTVRWQRLVSAMVDAGCAAISHGGSAVTFRHCSGSIAFHRPHPEDEIVPDVLRIMGKRLKKRLGWSVEVFVERSKGETKAQ
ncbi:hypothetical protein LTR17_005064 [Elasticomyces elasticus]|nr:hypothetical protein LTR17_005064 [Elasticomyces elasticus]